MTPGERRRLILAVALLVSLVAYVVVNFRVTTDIGEFLPDREDGELARLSREIADSELSRTMILAVEGPDTETALRASRAFEAELRADPRVANAIAFLEAGPPEGLDRALFDLYEPRRLSFLADDAEAARAQLRDDGLRAALRHLRDELAGPLSPLVSRVAAEDPFLTIPTLFERLERSRASRLAVIDGRFVSEDRRTAILFLGTRASAMDERAQAPLLDGISAACRARMFHIWS